MKDDLAAKIQESNEGHLVFLRAGQAPSVQSTVMRLVAFVEMKRRGVRFLPNQVVKRAMRDIKHAPAKPHNQR